MPAICRFYQKGYCRYGRNCRFIHPGEQQAEPNHYETTQSSNFSFRAALNDIVPQSQFPLLPQQQHYQQHYQQHFQQPQQHYNQRYLQQAYQKQYNQHQPVTSGFSFTKAIESSFKHDDIEMQEPVSLGNPVPIIDQHQLQQHQQQNIFNNAPSIDAFSQNNNFNISQTNNFTRPQDLSEPRVKPTQIGKTDFTSLQDLTEAEIEAFQSDRFEFRKIPIRPPPQTLC